MEIVETALGVLALLVALNFSFRVIRNQRRARAAAIPAGAAPRREARKIPSRVFVDKDIPGGPRAGGINRDPADLILTSDELLVATGLGLVLRIDRSRGGSARTTGPRRLVVEGLHPQSGVKVRAELLLDDAEGWAQDISGLAHA